MRARVVGHETREVGGWEVADTAPGEVAGPAEAAALDWRPAQVPGLRGGDDRDWWMRATFATAPADEVVLRFGGLATLSTVWVDGEQVAAGDSMFVPLEADMTALAPGEHALLVRCRALAPELAVARRPRARWRSRVPYDGNLRWFRTTLLGRAPGFAPGPPVVGPWQPVTLEHRRGLAIDRLALRPRLEGDEGVLAVTLGLRSLDGRALPDVVRVAVGGVSAELPRAGGEVRLPRVERWWPHTHGTPVLHAVSIVAGDVEIDAGRVGFRTLEDVGGDGPALAVNGVPLFARGALWTPAASPAERRAVLERARDAGLNLVRLPGTGAYEPAGFHDDCDELGLLVWQDLMFANLDFPFADPGFRALVDAEVAELADVVGGRPSLAVACAGSEIRQQVAMLGLDPALADTGYLAEEAPAALRAAGIDALWVPGAPSGGTLPFRVDTGVANYFGVGGYRRPLTDARHSGVRFAAECLAFANVGDHGEPTAGVPRDVGADWDFADVRDHYLRALHRADPAAAGWDRARLVTGEVMAEALGEWRRPASVCAGALVLWLRDVVPGSGWGVLDHAGRPKAAWHHLRRALEPIAVWTVDEGLNGIAVHVANDRPEPLTATLRLAFYHGGSVLVDQAATAVDVPPHGHWAADAEGLLGRFVDASYAYEFGPLTHETVVATLRSATGELLSASVRFVAGPPAGAEPAHELGLTGHLAGHELTVRSDRLAYGVRVVAAGFQPSDDAFVVEPGGERRVLLRPSAAGAVPEAVTLRAANLVGELVVPA